MDLVTCTFGKSLTAAFCRISTHCVVYLDTQGARHAFAGQVGRDTANPTAILLCAANMLKHLNLDSHAKKIKEAVINTIQQGKVCRPAGVSREGFSAHFNP